MAEPATRRSPRWPTTTLARRAARPRAGASRSRPIAGAARPTSPRPSASDSARRPPARDGRPAVGGPDRSARPVRRRRPRRGRRAPRPRRDRRRRRAGPARHPDRLRRADAIAADGDARASAVARADRSPPGRPHPPRAARVRRWASARPSRSTTRARIGGLDLVLPTDPAIGPPDAAYPLASRVALVWSERPGLPADPDHGVGLLLSEFRGHVDDGYFQKILDGSDQVDAGDGDGHARLLDQRRAALLLSTSTRAARPSTTATGSSATRYLGGRRRHVPARIAAADGGGDPPRRIAPLAGTAAGRVVYRDRRRAIPTRRTGARPMRHHRAVLVAISTAATLLGGCTAAASSPAGPTSVRLARRIRRAAGRLPAGDVGLRRARRRPRGRPAGRSAAHGDRREQRQAARPAAGRRADVGELGVPRHDDGQRWPDDRGATRPSRTAAVRRPTIDGAWAPADDRRRPDAGRPLGRRQDARPGRRPATPIQARATSRFAVVPFPPIEGAPELAPRVVELPGALDFDAISPDGRILYVVQHLDGERRLPGPGGRPAGRDDAAGDHRRQAQPRRGDGRLADRPAALADGIVLTLYRGTDHPFIHALNTTEAWAVCIDLPGGGSATDDADWGLAASTGWGSLYAVNATRGLAVDARSRAAHRPSDRDARDRGRPDVRAREVRSRRRRPGRAARRGDDRRVLRLRGRRRRRAPPGAGPERRPPAAAGPEGSVDRVVGRTAGRSSRSTPTGPFRPSTPRPARSSARSRATATTGSSRSCPGTDRTPLGG